MYLLLQFIKNLRAEELAQGDVQTVAELLYQIDRNLLAAWVKHTIYAGGRDAAAVGEFVGFDAPLLHKLHKTGGHGFFDGCHSLSPLGR